MAMNAVTIAAIVAACWAHPSGQAYLAKIDQIEELSIRCGNPCCKPSISLDQFGGKPQIQRGDLYLDRIRQDDNEIITILTAMLGELLP